MAVLVEKMVCDMLLPVPLAYPDKSNELGVAVQEKVVPATWERMSTLVVCPVQMVWAAGWKKASGEGNTFTR